jgi:hypothetical protein
MTDPVKARRLEALDLSPVELKRDVGRWSAGSIGTIVEAYSGEALVEFSDDDGRTLDLVVVPYDDLAILPPAEQPKLALWR